MTEFHDGQKIEALKQGEYNGFTSLYWHEAKIVRAWTRGKYGLEPMCDVEFKDGTRAIFGTDHIRPVAERCMRETRGTPEHQAATIEAIRAS